MRRRRKGVTSRSHGLCGDLDIEIVDRVIGTDDGMGDAGTVVVEQRNKSEQHHRSDLDDTHPRIRFKAHRADREQATRTELDIEFGVELRIEFEKPSDLVDFSSRTHPLHA